MAVIRGFLGSWDGSLSIVCESLIGAVIPLIKMLVRGILSRRLNYPYAYTRRLILTEEVTTYHDPSRGEYTCAIPFGLCLFLGVLVYLFFIKG